MLAWRLCRAPFADLSGEGARRYGGRWNRPGRPIVYAASSAALAVLEVRVHLDLPPALLPDDYLLLTIDCAIWRSRRASPCRPIRPRLATPGYGTSRVPCCGFPR